MTDQPDNTIPILEERAVVGKRSATTGRVRVRVETLSEETAVPADLDGEAVDIERIPVGAEIDAAPPVRTEGDTTIVPVIEEVLVVEKRLVLKEEIHIRRRPTHETVEVPVTLRRQRAQIEKLPAGGGDPETSSNKD
jgi:uncharacterized protein (TIGR02271 family)